MLQRSSTPGDKSIGQRIRFARIAKKMSQTNLGDILGVSFQQIQKNEKGVNRVTADRLTKMASHLGVTTNYLLGIEEGSEPISSDVEAILKWISKPANMKLVKACKDLTTAQCGLLAAFIESMSV